MAAAALDGIMPAAAGAQVNSDRRFFRNGKAVAAAAPAPAATAPAAARARDDPDSPVATSAAEDEELNDFLCKMCRGIPEVRPSKVGTFQQLFRTLFSSVGLWAERPQVPEGVNTFHDLVAKLLVEAEVTRLSADFPGLAGNLLNSDTLCLPLSLLKGRCVLVVNTASQ
mmetsp:Transcript_36373/g.104558  ORF Transcript_36373/g.104558 Transcript_36373/m.104558 type:complete len:169 (-) Transcript_36373:439-945(-)